jgi:archaellum component FlaF (FlaF/FlaG flagellin family)
MQNLILFADVISQCWMLRSRMPGTVFCIYLFVSQNYKYTKVKQKQENNKILTHSYLHSHALFTTISYTHTYPSVTHKVQVNYNGQRIEGVNIWDSLDEEIYTF